MQKEKCLLCIKAHCLALTLSKSILTSFIWLRPVGSTRLPMSMWSRSTTLSDVFEEHFTTVTLCCFKSYLNISGLESLSNISNSKVEIKKTFLWSKQSPAQKLAWMFRWGLCEQNLKYTFQGCIKLYFQLNITCMHAWTYYFKKLNFVTYSKIEGAQSCLVVAINTYFNFCYAQNWNIVRSKYFLYIFLPDRRTVIA